MTESINLTEGEITKPLIKLSLPIIATNFIQTAYGMVDMIWIGKLGSKAVASIGTASFFINLASALFTIIMIGSGVKIAQSIGAKKEEEIKIYIFNSYILTIILSLFYCFFIFLFKEKLIGFFKLGDLEIEKNAIDYLVYSLVGILFMYFNAIFSAILNSFGNTKIPFRMNTIGFVINIFLDPVLIFGCGPIKAMGVVGAAMATNIARSIVFLLFLKFMKKKMSFIDTKIKIDFEKVKEVIKMGFPITVQRLAFTVISIFIAKIISDFGASAIAVQRVGVQIEALSFMTIGGIQGAIATYIGQNYGAQKQSRIRKGYYSSLGITIVFGTLVSILFIAFPRQLIQFFIKEKEVIDLGVSYMGILGFSQVFMCMEILTVGAFNGIGKTYVPPIISISFTALRIPMALMLSKEKLFGLNGVWMSISLSSFIKGVILVFWFIYIIRDYSKKERMSSMYGA